MNEFDDPEIDVNEFDDPDIDVNEIDFYGPAGVNEIDNPDIRLKYTTPILRPGFPCERDLQSRQ